MGLLKKLTKPLSEVLDKIVPNEVKPYLPYLAAMAPFMLGPAAAGSTGFWNSMAGRAFIAGGANLGSQLSQEGSEGEFDELSLALASGIGALTAPGAPAAIRGVDPNFIGPQVAPEGFIGTGREYLARGAEFLGPGTGGATDILGPGGTPAGFDMPTLKAASVPLTQGTADLARIEAEQALRDYENEMAGTDDPLYSDEGRRRAIRAAMEAAGHLEETILDALASLGLKSGGMVGMKHGGQLVKRGPGRPGYAGNWRSRMAELIRKHQNRTITDEETIALEMMQDMAPGQARGGIAGVLPKGKEADYRGGGVIPIGSRERADDVPARLSKNEFVMTADAVRAAGGGNINQGAKRMYNLMNNLEARV